MSKQKKEKEEVQAEETADALPTPTATSSEEFQENVPDLPEVEVEAEVSKEAQDFFNDVVVRPAMPEDAEGATEIEKPKPTTDKVNSHIAPSERVGMRVGRPGRKDVRLEPDKTKAHRWTHKVYEDAKVNNVNKTTFRG